MAEEVVEKPKEEGEGEKAQEEKPAERPEEEPEETPTEESLPDIGEGIKGDFFSPMAGLLFFTALVFDLVGLIIFILGIWFAIDDFGLLDISGLVIIGGLMYVHTGNIVTTKKAEKAVKEITKKAVKRIGLSFLGELIPYFGGLAPCWTVAVYFHLKNS